MKIIKIGRDSSCNIMLEHEMISRNHAILRVYSTGRIELISMGTNGTKLNGILVRPNVVYKVKRSDMISFAGKFQLDWAKIPDPLRIYRIVGICMLAIILLSILSILGYSVYNYFNPQVESHLEYTSIEKRNGYPKEPEVKVDSEIYNPDNITLSIEDIVINNDSIKKLKNLEDREIDNICKTLFPKKKKKKTSTTADNKKQQETNKSIEKSTEKENNKQQKTTTKNVLEEKNTEKDNSIKNTMIH